MSCRPELEKPKKASTRRRSNRVEANETSSAYFSHENEPLSPPGSMEGSNGMDPMEASGTVHDTDLWPVGDVLFTGDDNMPPESYDFLLNASWGSKPQESSGTDLLYNDLFAPDTGKS